jgi:hypothetical protein
MVQEEWERSQAEQSRVNFSVTADVETLTSNSPHQPDAIMQKMMGRDDDSSGFLVLSYH